MDKDLLHICLEAIAKKVNEGDIEYWTDGTFIRLSEAVEEKTGILISRNTLKRLFGKMKTPDDYNPQRETKNALAIFAGYKSWEDLKQEVLENKQPEKIVLDKSIEDKGAKPNEDLALKEAAGKSRFKALILTSIILFFCLAIFYWKKSDHGIKALMPGAKMQILNPVDTVPFTMRVSYQTENIVEDSLFFNSQKVITNTSRFNMGISTPVYTWLTLKYKNKKLAAAPYHAISKGWVNYYQKKNKSSFVFIHDEAWKKNGVAALSKKWFEGKALDSTNFYWYLKNFKNFALQADNFTLECKTKIEGDGIGCGGLLLMTIGEHGHLETCLNSKSCANYNFLYLSDLIVEGEYNDLPNLDLKTNKWSVIRMQVKNQNVIILVDGKSIYEGKYKKSVGQIKGFNLKVQGFGAVDYFKAWDETGKLVEEENF